MAGTGDTLTIPSRVECIDDARGWVGGRVREAGFDDEAVGEIELALTEALANDALPLGAAAHPKET